MSGNFILVDGEPRACRDSLKWAKWFETATADRIVQQDTVGDVRVSTVFLGVDHNFGDGPPLLWETMIFGGKHDEYQERYTTRAEALAGHRTALGLVTT